MIAFLRGPRGRGRRSAGAHVGSVSGHGHLEAAEFGWEALVHVEVVIRLALLLKDLVEHRGTLPGGEAVSDGWGLTSQDHLGWKGRWVLLFLLLLVLLHPEKTRFIRLYSAGMGRITKSEN